MFSKRILPLLVVLALLTTQSFAGDDSDKKEPDSHKKPTVRAGLIDPDVRDETDIQKSTPGEICGGLKRGPVHYVTSPGLKNHWKWYVETGVPDAQCQFRISENLDQNNDTAYVPVIPTNAQDIDGDGFFPCGEAGVHEAIVKFPDTIDCDKCVLEWIFMVEELEVEIRECADITVNLGEKSVCSGQCNSGICSHGVCHCPEGDTGKYCEGPGGGFWAVLKVLLYIILILAIVAGLAFGVYYLYQNKQVIYKFFAKEEKQDETPLRDIEEKPQQQQPVNEFNPYNRNLARRLRRDSDRQSYRPSTNAFDQYQ